MEQVRIFSGKWSDRDTTFPNYQPHHYHLQRAHPGVPFFLNGECRENAKDGAHGRIEPWYAAEVRDKNPGIIRVTCSYEVEDQSENDQEWKQLFYERTW